MRSCTYSLFKHNVICIRISLHYFVNLYFNMIVRNCLYEIQLMNLKKCVPAESLVSCHALFSLPDFYLHPVPFSQFMQFNTPDSTHSPQAPVSIFPPFQFQFPCQSSASEFTELSCPSLNLAALMWIQNTPFTVNSICNCS